MPTLMMTRTSRKTLEESKRLHTENEETKKRIAQMEVAGNDTAEKDKKQTQDLDRQKTEEEIVLEYVKKQSLLEEEHRQGKEQAQ